MDQILEKLFESVPKARILRLFLRNPGMKLCFEDIVKRSQVRPPAARHEIKKLEKLGIVRREVVFMESGRKPPRAGRGRKMRVYSADHRFPCFQELQDLIVKSSTIPSQKIWHDLRSIGKVKLAVVSGIFVQSDNSRTDLLVVGDRIQRRKLEKFLADTESHIGKSIQHTVMDTKEFLYRMDMYDRFLRDILEYPHEKLINKFNI